MKKSNQRKKSNKKNARFKKRANKINKPKKTNTIAIVAAGTGGHIFPGIAIAEQCKQKVIFLGSKDRIENKIIPHYKCELKKIDIPRDKISIFKTIKTARKILKEIRPRKLITFGGYISFPFVIAARWLRIPVILHEQNTIPGLTNRVVSLFSKKVCITYPQSKRYFLQKKKIIHTGNPVRKSIIKAARNKKSHKKIKNIFIFGGSQGAQRFDIVAEQLKKKKYKVHYLGRNSFSFNMEKYFQKADLVICRAGATSLAEIACFDLPAILIPYPHATNNHQWHNAQYFVKNKAAYVVPQSMLSIKILTDIMKTINLSAMQKNMKKLADPQSAQKMVEIINKK
ncbi:glycosyltransferase [Candidatus Margulisiibacteriota bacterium]